MAGDRLVAAMVVPPGHGGAGGPELGGLHDMLHDVAFAAARHAVARHVPDGAVDAIDAVLMRRRILLGAIRTRLGRQGLELGLGDRELGILRF